MYELSKGDIESVSGGWIIDAIEGAYYALKLLEGAYEANTAVWGEDVANELLAAGGLGA